MKASAKLLGQRIHYYRKQKDWSQEDLAYNAGIHPSYVGQLERGEKNMTIETLLGISKALEVPLTKILELFDESLLPEEEKSAPVKCYELLSGLDRQDQKKVLTILEEIVEYKH